MAKLERVYEGVMCDVHGAIHDHNTDPYGYGDEEPECGPKDWRKLWAGAYVQRTRPRRNKEADDGSK